jgi:hypothetical protein
VRPTTLLTILFVDLASLRALAHHTATLSERATASETERGDNCLIVDLRLSERFEVEDSVKGPGPFKFTPSVERRFGLKTSVDAKFAATILDSLGIEVSAAREEARETKFTSALEINVPERHTHKISLVRTYKRYDFLLCCYESTYSFGDAVTETVAELVVGGSPYVPLIEILPPSPHSNYTAAKGPHHIEVSTLNIVIEDPGNPNEFPPMRFETYNAPQIDLAQGRACQNLDWSRIHSTASKKTISEFQGQIKAEELKNSNAKSAEEGKAGSKLKPKNSSR